MNPYIRLRRRITKPLLTALLAASLLSSCSLMGDPLPATSAPTTIGQSEKVEVNNTTNTSLEWWQWVLIGFLIPDPFTIIGGWIKSMRGGIL